MSSVSCIVPICKAKPQNSNIPFHRFPTDLAKRKLWAKALGKKEIDIKTSWYICARHFRSKDYYPGGKRLNNEAIPSLRLTKGPTKTTSIKPLSKKSQSSPNKESNANILSRKSTLNHNSFKKIGKGAQVVSPKNKVKQKIVVKVNHATSVRTKGLDSEYGSKKFVNRLNNQNKLSPNMRKMNTSLTLKNISQRSPLTHNNPFRRGRSGGVCDYKELQQKIVQRTLNKSIKKPLSTLETQSIGKPPPTLETETSSSETLNNTTDASAEDLNAIKEQDLVKQSEIVTETVACTQNIFQLDSLHPQSISISQLNERKDTCTPTNTMNSLKRSVESETCIVEPKRKRIRRKRLVSTESSPDEQMERRPISQKRKSTERSRSTTKTKENKNLTNIEKTIVEMQDKIQKLERQSILDEKRIETFKKALIQQRNNDLKIIMDEKENELLLRMDLLYLDYDPYRICRLCLLLVDRKEALTSLFWPPKNQALIQLIRSTTGVQIEPEDGMPSGICSDCLQQMKRVDWLKRKTQRSNTLIKKFLTLKKSMAEKSNAGTSNAVIYGNAKPLFIDDMFEEETGTFKIEDVFSLENSPEIVTFENVVVKEEHDFDEVSELSQESVLSLPRMRSRKPQKCRRCQTVFTNPWSLKNHRKLCNKTFQCLECMKCFWNARLFHRHKLMKNECVCPHQLRSCYECELLFRYKWAMVFHVFRHKPQICGICFEEFISPEQVQNHLVEYHQDCDFVLE